MNAVNMNPNDFLNKAALTMNLENGFSGLSNDMGLSSMGMNMNMNMNMNTNMGALNRNSLMGVSNMRNTSGLMGGLGMNGMGMNSMAPMSYSRELEEMLVMNRLRSEVNTPGDSSLLGSLYNGKPNGDSGGLSGLNMMAGMDESAMLEEFQRRRLRLDAAAKKEEAMSMLRDSERMSRWADKGNGNNKSSLNDSAMDFNSNTSGLNGMNGGGLGSNGANSGMGFMGMSSLGGASGNLDNMNASNLDSMATSSLLSKLASGNGKMSDQFFVQGASNFGNTNNMANSLMNNLNNNLGPISDSLGDNNGQLPISNNGLGQQQPYNYDMP